MLKNVIKHRTIVVGTNKLEQLVIMLAAYRSFITCIHSCCHCNENKKNGT